MINFVTLAQRLPGRREEFLGAARLLIEETTRVLGRPRQDEGVDFVGMRIGKVEARRQSDFGMEYDGMYWHYTVMWLFALLRYARAANDDAYLQRAIVLVENVHPRFFDGNGIRWKLNTDASPIVGFSRARPSDDALSAYILYQLLAAHKEVLEKPISDLVPVVERLPPRVTADPLGFGLAYWKLQWLTGSKANAERRDLHYLANEALAPDMSLPFRLYGAIIGAKLPRDPTLENLADNVLNRVAPTQLKQAYGPHSAINKVMFAAALDPLGFQRLPDEPDIPFI